MSYPDDMPPARRYAEAIQNAAGAFFWGVIIAAFLLAFGLERLGAGIAKLAPPTPEPAEVAP